ncbi:uncharacterized protein PAE49_021577 isoform 2-T2 [Odontesthes bonariensis]|uniref:uncharacterized protein LOC142368871 isoform X2 n=1 Tax=Odontesthes bonariensis TaxID=219752 RepID=UPI003F585B05
MFRVFSFCFGRQKKWKALSLLMSLMFVWCKMSGSGCKVAAKPLSGSDADDACPPNALKYKRNPPVKAVNGSTVTLPCIPKLPLNNDHILEWKKDGSDILIVKENTIQNEKNKNRMRLAASIEGLKKQNASLQIDHVVMSDIGTYCCCIRLPGVYLYCVNQTLELTNGDPNPEGIQQTTVNPTPTPVNLTDKTDIVLAVVVVVVVVVVVAVAVACYCIKKRGARPKRRGSQQEGDAVQETIPMTLEENENPVRQSHVV